MIPVLFQCSGHSSSADSHLALNKGDGARPCESLVEGQAGMQTSFQQPPGWLGWLLISCWGSGASCSTNNLSLLPACPSNGPSSPPRETGALSGRDVGTEQLLLPSQSPSTSSTPKLTPCSCWGLAGFIPGGCF